MYVCLYPADVVRFTHEENAPHFKEGCIVTDVCGIKNQVCGKLTEIAKNYPFVYVGGHPMAGKERSGFDASGASLFIMLPIFSCPAKLRKAPQMPLVSLAKSMGFGTIKYCTQQKHDRMIAYTSQIPHVLACAYIWPAGHSGFSRKQLPRRFARGAHQRGAVGRPFPCKP